MSTPAQNAITALLGDSAFNTLVASLKQKRDEIDGYQYSINNYQTALATFQANLAGAQAEEVLIQQQVATAGAAIIQTVLP